jgi:hypothetical protein
MQTNVENGDVIAVGLNCLPVFYLTAAGEMLSMMPAANVARYAEACADVTARLAVAAETVADGGADAMADEPTATEALAAAKAEAGNGS